MSNIIFEEIEWANRGMRGKPFGVRGKTYCYFDSRGPWTFEMTTGAKPEQKIGLAVDVKNDPFRNPFGPQLVNCVFSESPTAADGLKYSDLFLSESGKDEWARMVYAPDGKGGMHMVKGAGRDPLKHALKPNTKYYMTVSQIPTANDSGNPADYGIRLSYVSTSQDDLADMPIEVASGIRMQMEVQGTWVMGTWYPDSEE